VLSPDPDNGRDYTQDYYAKYRQEDRLVFPVSRSSDTVRPKTVVYGFDLGKHSVAITESLLQHSSQYVIPGTVYLSLDPVITGSKDK
jgi:hypothetical protein